ncbi:MAG: response regulator [Bacteroidales bacterium]|nr:response regulator [Bacteroidales bacterium]
MNSPDFKNVEILLVEDNPDDARLTLRAFKKNKLTNQLLVVQDGEEALDFIFARGKFSMRAIDDFPRVILLDLKLPKVNGLEVLKEIKNDDRTKSIPIVVLTSSKEESDIRKAYNFGVNSYIVKPVDFENFAITIREIGLYWLMINIPPA